MALCVGLTLVFGEGAQASERGENGNQDVPAGSEPLGSARGDAQEKGATAALHRLATLLWYVSEEYPEALEEASEDEYAEQRRVMGEAVKAAESLSGGKYLPRIKALQDLVHRREKPVDVARDLDVLASEIVASAGIDPSPSSPPSLARGQAVFERICVQCHKSQETGGTTTPPALDPPPASFFDADIMNRLSPFKAYGLVTYGVPGTGMAPFEGVLSEADRWSVAFYLFTLRQPPCTRMPVPRPSLRELALSSDQELVVRYREQSLPCLRRRVGGSGESGTGEGAASPRRRETRRKSGEAMLVVSLLLGLGTAWLWGRSERRAA